CSDNPVALPSGRARLVTKPLPTGSFATANTIGMSRVACFTASTAPPDVTITSTLSRVNSAAISAKRSLRPSAHLKSIAKLRPSLQLSSRRRCTKAFTHPPHAAGVVVPRKPTVGNLAGCCARAATGHAAAPPSTPRNLRRLISSPKFTGHHGTGADGHLGRGGVRLAPGTAGLRFADGVGHWRWPGPRRADRRGRTPRTLALPAGRLPPHFGERGATLRAELRRIARETPDDAAAAGRNAAAQAAGVAGAGAQDAELLPRPQVAHRQGFGFRRGRRSFRFRPHIGARPAAP